MFVKPGLPIEPPILPELTDAQRDYVEQLTTRELLEWGACVGPNDLLSQAAIKYGLSRKGAELARRLRVLK